MGEDCGYHRLVAGISISSLRMEQTLLWCKVLSAPFADSPAYQYTNVPRSIPLALQSQRSS